jgi:hypothetical protein
MPVPPVKRILAFCSSIGLAALSTVIDRVLAVLHTEVIDPLLPTRVKRPLLLAATLSNWTKEQAGSTVPVKLIWACWAWLGMAHSAATLVKAPTIIFLFTIEAHSLEASGNGLEKFIQLGLRCLLAEIGMILGFVLQMKLLTILNLGRLFGENPDLGVAPPDPPILRGECAASQTLPRRGRFRVLPRCLN